MKFGSNLKIHRDQKFVDNYFIGKSLGCGTFSEVRRCRQVQTGVKRAVKILRKDRMDEFELKRFQHELDVL